MDGLIQFNDMRLNDDLRDELEYFGACSSEGVLYAAWMNGTIYGMTSGS